VENIEQLLKQMKLDKAIKPEPNLSNGRGGAQPFLPPKTHALVAAAFEAGASFAKPRPIPSPRHRIHGQ